MKKLVLSLAIGLLVGCAGQKNTQVVDLPVSNETHTTLQTMNYIPLTVYEDVVKQTVRMSDRMVSVAMPGVDSGVVGWKVPAYGVYRFTLSSEIVRGKFGREATAFMPEVRLLDESFNAIRVLPAQALKYQEPGIMGKEYFFHSFVVDNRDPHRTPIEYLAVMMTDEGRQHQIEVMNLEEEYAKVRGTSAANIGNIMGVASDAGTLMLEAVSVVAPENLSPIEVPSFIPKLAIGKKTEKAAKMAFDITAISLAYRDEVKQQLASGDVVSALEMRNGLDALQGVLQADFAELYEKDSSGRIQIPPSRAKETLGEQLMTAYRGQLNAYFAAGDTQQALALLDQAKNLKAHIDGLF